MDNFILAYQGNFLVAENSTASELRPCIPSCIDCFVYKWCDPGRCLVKGSHAKLHVANVGEKFKILRFDCVIDEYSGLQQPYLLVQRSRIGKQNDTENSLELFLLSGLEIESESPVFQNIGSFNLRGDNLARVAVKLCDGPTICWVDGHQVCFVGKEGSNDNRLTLKSWPETGSSLGRKSIAELDIVWCGNIDNKSAVIVTQRQYSDVNNTTETKLVCIDMHHNKEYHCKEFQLVPDVYVGITTCYHLYTDYMHAETMEIVDNDFGIPFSENENGSSLFSRTKILLGTSQAQLVEFHRGQLKNFYLLPFEDPCKINLVEVDGFELVAVVQSLKGEVCAINLSSRQVIRKWKGIERLFVDDFLGRGTEQVLLFSKHQSFGDVITDFTLADIVESDISGAKEENNPDIPLNSKECNESLERTVHALAMRLQAGVSSVVETQVEYQEKLEMIRKTCNNLHRIVSSRGSCSFANKKPAGMFCLLEGKHCKKENEVQEELAEVRPQIQVEDVWQRVVDDKWIVGVEFINTGTRVVDSFSLALVGTQPEVLSSTCHDGISCANTSCKGKANSKCSIKLDTTLSDDILKPPRKKMRIKDFSDVRHRHGLLPGNKTVVVSVTDIPELLFDKDYTCSPVLTYQNKSRDGNQFNESISCAPVTISANQLSEGKLELGMNKDSVSQKRDWIALEAVSIKIQLVLTSTLSSLSNVSSLLRDLLGVSNDAIIAVASIDGVDGSEPFPCLKSINSSLSGACVLVHSSWLREARLLIFTRNLRQLCVLLHKMRQVLPDDVTILPHTSQLVSDAAVKAVTAMTSEVSTLISGVKEVLRTRQGDTSAASDSSCFRGNKQEELQFARREFERRRAKGKETTVDDAIFRGLWDSSLKEQLETDAAVNCFVSLSLY